MLEEFLLVMETARVQCRLAFTRCVLASSREVVLGPIFPCALQTLLS